MSDGLASWSSLPPARPAAARRYLTSLLRIRANPGMVRRRMKTRAGFCVLLAGIYLAMAYGVSWHEFGPFWLRDVLLFGAGFFICLLRITLLGLGALPVAARALDWDAVLRLSGDHGLTPPDLPAPR
jgi:hypothetical protein